MGVLDGLLSPRAGRQAREETSSVRSTLGAVSLAAISVLLAASVIGGMTWGYFATATPVTVQVDGRAATLRTHRDTVGDLLEELQIALLPEDRLSPPRDTPLTDGLTIEVARARPFALLGDTAVAQVGPEIGQRQIVRTHATTLGEALAELGVVPGPYDELTLEGQPATADTPLPPVILDEQSQPAGLPRLYPWHGAQPRAVAATIQRAVPLVLQDEGPAIEIWTTATSVGEALSREGLIFYEGDRVRPELGTALVAGLHVFVERSKPVAIQSKDDVLYTRTRQGTVAELLTEQGLLITGGDRVEPALDTTLSDDLVVRIVRVQQVFEVEEDITPYLSIWEPDPEIEIDTRRLDQEGKHGITRHRFRVVLEDGEPVTRTLEDTWLAQEPITKVLKYGTKIVLRDLETPQGLLTYWRKVRMFATSYSADESGVPVDAAYYGRTRLGTPVGYGVAAVDPRVVKLGSDVFVPGYGVASADDTGGAIKGRWIDLAYDEGQLVPWSRCVDVYLLGPVPPSYQIQYTLPSWPQVACLNR